jgi:tRNA uridine 5-carboxymethylaminomethyl modification enzyme
MDRQASDIASVRSEESRLIPEDFDFQSLSGLSNELKYKLRAAKPRNLAQAMKVDGITPSAISLILAHMRKGNHTQAEHFKQAIQ